MGAGETIVGRRLRDTIEKRLPLPYNELQPGDIWKLLDEDGEPLKSSESTNRTGYVWMLLSPAGVGLARLTKHTVREHDDGTVSVRPGDGSSNSIIVSNGSGTIWHGYICHNEWTSVD